jgi:hypothetical protein
MIPYYIRLTLNIYLEVLSIVLVLSDSPAQRTVHEQSSAGSQFLAVGGKFPGRKLVTLPPHRYSGTAVSPAGATVMPPGTQPACIDAGALSFVTAMCSC